MSVQPLEYIQQIQLPCITFKGDIADTEDKIVVVQKHLKRNEYIGNNEYRSTPIVKETVLKKNMNFFVAAEQIEYLQMHYYYSTLCIDERNDVLVLDSAFNLFRKEGRILGTITTYEIYKEYQNSLLLYDGVLIKKEFAVPNVADILAVVLILEEPDSAIVYLHLGYSPTKIHRKIKV